MSGWSTRSPSTPPTPRPTSPRWNGSPSRHRGVTARAGKRQTGRLWCLQAGRIDPGLARAGIARLRVLPGTAEDQVLLCTDLHGDKIRAAQRAPWLVIDPKLYVGDPAYAVLQQMLTCEDRLAADPAVLATRMAGLAGMDAGRVRLWLFASSVQGSIYSPLMRQVARQLAAA